MSHQVQALTVLMCTMHWGLQQLCERGEGGGGALLKGGGDEDETRQVGVGDCIGMHLWLDR
jgi:hypothetical protein